MAEERLAKIQTLKRALIGLIRAIDALSDEPPLLPTKDEMRLIDLMRRRQISTAAIRAFIENQLT